MIVEHWVTIIPGIGADAAKTGIFPPSNYHQSRPAGGASALVIDGHGLQGTLQPLFRKTLSLISTSCRRQWWSP